jgi:hypothetical protein
MQLFVDEIESAVWAGYCFLEKRESKIHTRGTVVRLFVIGK